MQWWLQYQGLLLTEPGSFHIALLHESNLLLLQFIAGFRFMPTNERPVEAMHSLTHKHGLRASQHTERYISFSIRCKFIRDHLQKDPRSIHAFAYTAGLARNYYSAIRTAGLEDHPTVEEARRLHRLGLLGRRNRLDDHVPFAHIIYRSDSSTLYNAPPALAMRPVNAAQ